MSEHFKHLGFRNDDNLLMKFVGGSQLHGAKLEGYDDTDYYGLWIEPPSMALGVDSDEHFVYTTGGARGGNGPGDVDVCLYTLRKWARLAAKGNPSVLHFLFCKAEFETLTWCRLKLKREAFLAKSHANQFLGFANAQLRRLFNQQGQKNIHREELEKEHGYDSKYAMHVIRLYLEAKEYMSTGVITLPSPWKDTLVDIRKGKYKLTEFQAWGSQLEAEVKEAQLKSPLPEKVDRKTISDLVAGAHLEHWALRGLDGRDRYHQ